MSIISVSSELVKFFWNDFDEAATNQLNVTEKKMKEQQLFNSLTVSQLKNNNLRLNWWCRVPGRRAEKAEAIGLCVFFFN